MSGIPTHVRGLILESQDETGLGLKFTTFHVSTGCTAEACCDGQQVSEMTELGRIGVGRMISTTGLGGGGIRWMNRFDICCLTSSLFPQRSSPAPSSSRPSRARALVR